MNDLAKKGLGCFHNNMKISALVKTGAKQNEVKKMGEVYKIRVKARPIEGAANDAVI